MDEFFDLPTLIVIGVAVVILFRLRSVLGTRTGTERPPVERRRPEEANGRAGEETVVPLRPQGRPAPSLDDERRARKLEAEIEQFSHGDSGLAANLKAVADADAGFSPKSFLEGAKMAYEMIVTAFAQGDRVTLKSLLEKDVFEDFQRAIAEREAAGRRVDFRESDRFQMAMSVVQELERRLPLPPFELWVTDYLAHPDHYRRYAYELHRGEELP
jgi:predicted lipid-binding transport protein (Tim44 family)